MNETFTITLDVPIQRKGGDITEITLRRPNSGELRGLNLQKIATLDMDAVSMLIPRIVQPMLTQDEINSMDLADLSTISYQIYCFFLPKSKRQELGTPNG